MRQQTIVDLNSMRRYEEGRISHIDGGIGLQDKLKAMGLRPGQKIRKISKESMHMPNRIEVMGTELAIGHRMAENIKVLVKARSILLAGNPNVGKSVVFSRLTGVNVISSNYPGTTVEYTMGNTSIAGERFTIIDVPGAYSSHGTNKAEEAASSIINKMEGSLLVNVVDSTNLERNLFYTLELASLGRPMIVLLNKWDIAKRHGISIDVQKLSEKLGVTVIPVVATTSEGIGAFKKALEAYLEDAVSAPIAPPATADERWQLIGRISADCQTIMHKHASFIEKLQDLTSRQSTGLPFALLVLVSSFFVIRFIGEGLIDWVLDPIFEKLWLPLVEKLISPIGEGFFRTLLYGNTPDPLDSFGILVTGVHVPLVTVLPYIVAFYLILSLLEDSGYLPRLAVLMDNFMHKLGLHGYSVIPLMLGLGCKVPAIISTRVLETKKEQIIAAALTLALAPCMPQSAMIISLLAPYHFKYTFITFSFILMAGLTAAFLLSRIKKGDTPELFVEIPPYQLPSLNILFRKVWLRLKDFLFEAVPMIFLGIFIVNLIDTAGFFRFITPYFEPIFKTLFNLPAQTVSVVLLGFLRKDVCISMLAPFNLEPAQIAVASVFLTLYLPCIGTFMVALRELKARYATIVFAINFAAAIAAAALLNLVIRIL